MGDDEVLADLARGVLETEADARITRLLRADHVIAAMFPALPQALDTAAAVYAEARETWHADMLCGDLPPDETALARAKELRGEALVRMLAAVSDFPEGPETASLLDAVKALWGFLAGLDGDQRDDLAEYIAGELGETGPRYVLGV